MFCSAGGNGAWHSSSRNRIVDSVVAMKVTFFSFSSELQSLSYGLQTQPARAAFCFESRRSPHELSVFGSQVSGFGSSLDI
jgi:hypothetical protein